MNIKTDSLTQAFTDKASEYLSTAQKIVIVLHKNPDGDAIGSGLGLVHMFELLEKEAIFIVPNQLPIYLNWMKGYDNILVYEKSKNVGKKMIEASDLVLMVDFNHRSRLSEVGDVLLNHGAPSIMIDHHPNPEELANLTYSRTSASSTAEMVYEFITQIFDESKVSQHVAECLFVGIMTDTGSFSYNSSNPATFQIVSNLLQKGIDKDAITDKVYNNYSESRLRLLGHAVNTKMVVMPEYQAAYIYLSKEDMETYNFQPGDTEGFVNYPLSIRNVVVSAIFIEKDEITKCSFRSKGNFPANLVASENFNGGGHVNAAGGESKMGLSETIHKFEQIIPHYEKFLKSDQGN